MGSKGIVASAAAIGVLLAGGHRRHDPLLADARARRRSHARGAGRPGAAADDGLPHLRAARRRLPRLRADHLDGVPGARPRHPGLDHAHHAGVAREISRRRRRSTSPSWAASSTARANPSTPTSASRCRAPARRPPPRSSSTARRPMTLRGPTIAAEFRAIVAGLHRAPLRGGRSRRGRVSSARSRRHWSIASGADRAPTSGLSAPRPSLPSGGAARAALDRGGGQLGRAGRSTAAAFAGDCPQLRRGRTGWTDIRDEARAHAPTRGSAMASDQTLDPAAPSKVAESPPSLPANCRRTRIGRSATRCWCSARWASSSATSARARSTPCKESAARRRRRGHALDPRDGARRCCR